MMSNFEPLHKLQAHNGYILKCLLSPELCDPHRYLATASSDHTVKTWNVDGFTLEKTLTGHQRWVWDCVFSVDGAFLIIASSDATARLWSMANGEAIRMYQGHHTVCCALHVELNLQLLEGGMQKFTDEVGRLWTSLADYYSRRNLVEKARDILEEGMTTVVTVRDFSVIFDAYSQFEESMLALKMDEMSESEEDNDGEKSSVEDDNEDDCLNVAKLEEKLKRFWLCDDKDVNLRLARLEHLMDRRPELGNSVLLRQNPHNVEQWHWRVKLFEGNPMRQILTYTEAVRTVDPMKAVGKPHTLWVSFAKSYEGHKDIVYARVIFDKVVQVNYKTVDNLASIWCEWAEMELKHKNFKGALELMR